MTSSNQHSYKGIAVDEPGYQFLVDLENASGSALNIIEIDQPQFGHSYLSDTIVINEQHVLQFSDRACGKLFKIPDSIGNLSFLRRLKIFRGDRLKTLPRQVARCKQIERADLFGFTDLPPAICELESMKYLHATVERLPGEIVNMRRLDGLYLNKSPLKELPASICRMNDLSELDLSATNVSALPSAIGHLQSLSRLCIQGTWIERLPPSMASLASLTRLEVDSQQYEVLLATSGDVIDILKRHCTISRNDAMEDGTLHATGITNRENHNKNDKHAP